MKAAFAAVIASIAFLTLGSPSNADQHMTNMKLNSMKVVHMCPRGKYWVNGYVRNHHRVAGYCRRR
jgi:hypothetical protein